MVRVQTNNGRAAFKRETLLNNLSSVVTKLPQLDLPADITSIYAFGGVLRDKERLHDIDSIFVYSQNPQQRERWDKFRKNFASIDFDNRTRRPIAELADVLNPYYESHVLLATAVKTQVLSEALISRGVEPQWAGCFSWTYIYNNPIGFFFPDVERVLQRMLFKGVKGLSAIFVENNEFVEGKSHYSKLNSILAWTPEKPDIVANLLGRTPEEKIDLIMKELGMFLNLISELQVQYEKVKSSLQQAPTKLNLEALERCHVQVSYSIQEPYPDLIAKCEQARNEVRRLNEEIAVLKTIESALSNIAQRREAHILENPVEEELALVTLEWQPKYEVKENRIREILRILGLPEQKVKAVKIPGSKTIYELSELQI